VRPHRRSACSEAAPSVLNVLGELGVVKMIFGLAVGHWTVLPGLHQRKARRGNLIGRAGFPSIMKSTLKSLHRLKFLHFGAGHLVNLRPRRERPPEVEEGFLGIAFQRRLMPGPDVTVSTSVSPAR